MTKEELGIILDKQRKLQNGERGGELSILSGVDLTGVDLTGVDLTGVDLTGADLTGVDLSDVTLTHASLREASLYGTDLFGADLRGADLRGADLDYSCLPLWCGSLYAHFDDRQLRQIAYHLVCAGLHSKNASEETKRELVKILDFANGFHRAEECGILKNPFDKDYVKENREEI